MFQAFLNRPCLLLQIIYRMLHFKRASSCVDFERKFAQTEVFMLYFEFVYLVRGKHKYEIMVSRQSKLQGCDGASPRRKDDCVWYIQVHSPRAPMPEEASSVGPRGAAATTKHDLVPESVVRVTLWGCCGKTRRFSQVAMRTLQLQRARSVHPCTHDVHVLRVPSCARVKFSCQQLAVARELVQILRVTLVEPLFDDHFNNMRRNTTVIFSGQYLCSPEQQLLARNVQLRIFLRNKVAV